MSKIDHLARALRRLPEQFKNKTRIVQLLTTLVTQCGPAEDALYQLLTERYVSNAIGVQLDQLGKLVGQPRNGLLDDVYRRYIRTRIAANRSRGNIEDLIRVAELVLADATIQIVTTLYTGAVTVALQNGAITDEIAGVVITFLRKAVTAGIRLYLESYPDEPAETFTTDMMLTMQGTYLIGDDAIEPKEVGLAFMSAWPDTGTIEIDSGVNLETISYRMDTLNDPPAYLYLDTPLAKNHADGTEVRLIEAQQFGKGYGASGDAGQPTLVPYSDVGTTGGRMADVRI